MQRMEWNRIYSLSGARLIGAVTACAIASRLALLAWALAVTAVVPPFDASVWHASTTAAGGPVTLSAAARRLYPLSRWDGHHFLGIATRGYDTEQSLAFLPLYPAIVRTVCRVASSLAARSWIDNATYELDPSCAILSGSLLNLRLFVLASVLLLYLSSRVMGSRRMAITSTILFILSPAGIFFSATYTESLFAAASFGCLLLLEEAATSAVSSPSGLTATPRVRPYAFLLAGTAAGIIAACVRSNGVLLCPWVIYAGARVADGHRRRWGPSRGGAGVTAAWAAHWLLVLPCAAALLLPTAVHAAYGWSLHCTTSARGAHPAWLAFVRASRFAYGLLLPHAGPPAAADSVAPFDEPSWCGGRMLGPLFPVPPLYSAVQEKYWGVGPLFSYWEVKQLPQFAIAAPIILLALWACESVLQPAVRGRWWGYARRLARTLLPPGLAPSVTAPMEAGLVEVMDIVTGRMIGPAPASLLSHPTVLPYLLHWAALCVLGVLVMYVQVTVRVTAAACPALYWAAAVAWTAEADAKGEGAGLVPPSPVGARKRRGSVSAVVSASASGGSSVRQRRKSSAVAEAAAEQPALAVEPAAPATVPLPHLAAVAGRVRFRRAWIALCLVYSLLGTTLFCLGYNWT